MIKILLFALLSFSALGSVVLKKGQLVVCPITNQPVYKMVEALNEGESFKSEKMIDLKTNKAPIKGERIECDAVVFGWGGACIFTNQGWVPDYCKKHLRANYSWVPIIE